jgi:hypothetical protein
MASTGLQGSGGSEGSPPGNAIGAPLKSHSNVPTGNSNSDSSFHAADEIIAGTSGHVRTFERVKLAGIALDDTSTEGAVLANFQFSPDSLKNLTPEAPCNQFNRYMMWRIVKCQIAVQSTSPMGTSSGSMLIGYQPDPENMPPNSSAAVGWALRISKSNPITARDSTEMDVEMHGKKFCKPGANPYPRLERYGSFYAIAYQKPGTGTLAQWTVSASITLEFYDPLVNTPTTVIKTQFGSDVYTDHANFTTDDFGTSYFSLPINTNSAGMMSFHGVAILEVVLKETGNSAVKQSIMKRFVSADCFTDSGGHAMFVTFADDEINIPAPELDVFTFNDLPFTLYSERTAATGLATLTSHLRKPEAPEDKPSMRLKHPKAGSMVRVSTVKKS